ncbi:MAG: hypothetical protein SVY10_19995 [Thermodesulfobacteriota bacterium]|nr:hypothetical protein [Thermodesulfobacteriota bacterium]
MALKMTIEDLENIKKAAFLHDLGKILNWKGYLHPLEGGRFLKFLGYNDDIVGAALYHHPGKHTDIKERINEDRSKPAGERLLRGLCLLDEYGNQEIIKLVTHIDQLVSGFDRLGDEEEAGRTSPIALRNPLTHLPLNGQLKEFTATIKEEGVRDPAFIAGQRYLREFVGRRYLKKWNWWSYPDIELVPLNNENTKDKVYKLTNDLKASQLLQPLMKWRDKGFNELYRAIKSDHSWRDLCLKYIPQGHHPPTDTLALWYHMQFSSAFAGIYALGGNIKNIEKDMDILAMSRLKAKKERLSENDRTELKRLEMEYGSEATLSIKVGFLYVRIKGCNRYFTTAYRLPDFTGTQMIMNAIRATVKKCLLDVRVHGLPVIWEDSFFYEGHTDYFVVIPVGRKKDEKKSDFEYEIDESDDFLKGIIDAIDTEKVLRETVNTLMKHPKLGEILGCSPKNDSVFGEPGETIVNNLKNWVSMDWTTRCFADFKDGNQLTPIYGSLWNRMRSEVETRIGSLKATTSHIAGENLCDSCRRNEGKEWNPDIIKDEIWAGQPLYYWIFRTKDRENRPGDKLCHACLLRRLLGKGTSLEKMTRPSNTDEDESRIAVIKGNVNRTGWYIGGVGDYSGSQPIRNEQSIYSDVWVNEISNRFHNDSVKQYGIKGQYISFQDLEYLAEYAKGKHGKGQIMSIDKEILLSSLGINNVKLSDISSFLKKDFQQYSDLMLKSLFFNPFTQMWCHGDTTVNEKSLGNYLKSIFDPPNPANEEEKQKIIRCAKKQIEDSYIETIQGHMKALSKSYPNPWILCPPSDIIKILFSGSPCFCHNVAIPEYGVSPDWLKVDNDIPTPSRTMTVSWLIQRAIEEIKILAETYMPEDEVSVVYAEGDEFLIVCRAEKAPDLAMNIFRSAISRLNSIPDDRAIDLEGFFPFTVRMGMVTGKKKHPMYQLLDLVDLLLSNARTPYNQNVIDFEDVTGGVDEKYLDRRKNSKDWPNRRPLPLYQFINVFETAMRLDADHFANRNLHLIDEVMRNTSLRSHEDKIQASFAYIAHKTVSASAEEKAMWDGLKNAVIDRYYNDVKALWKIIRGKEV